MNGITKKAVVESYGSFVRSIENKKYIDGVCSRNSTLWELTYNKNNVHGIVNKSGQIQRNGIKLKFSDQGVLKFASLKAFLSGKHGLKKVKEMLDDITKTYNETKLAENGSPFKLEIGTKGWLYKPDEEAVKEIFPRYVNIHR